MCQDFEFSSPSARPICTRRKSVPLPGGSKQDTYLSGLLSSDVSSNATTVVVETELTIIRPTLWTAEAPSLYTLVITLKDDINGTVIQSESCRVGVRSVMISNGLLKVNRRRLVVQGVNLHEHDPVLGHHVPRKLIEADIILMKRNNFNSLRTSHYPHTPWLYELCSLYGIYVVDEANIETHGMKPYAGR